jgi:uncharacterized RDD family membrane protein YckC
MNDQWWYQLGGQTMGPASSHDVRGLVAHGSLSLDSPVIPHGGQTWGTIRQYAGDLGLSTPSYVPPPAPSPLPPPFAQPPPQAAAPPPYAAPPPPFAPPLSPPPPTPPAGYGGYPQQPSYPPPPASYAPATRGFPVSTPARRLGGAVLDGVIGVVLYVIAFAAAAGGNSAGLLFIGLLAIVGLEVYFWTKGQSPAKAMLGMRCVNAQTGQPATFGTMLLREVVGKALLGGISFGITSIVSCFMILGADRQGIWDKIATTVVVDVASRPAGF